MRSVDQRPEIAIKRLSVWNPYKTAVNVVRVNVHAGNGSCVVDASRPGSNRAGRIDGYDPTFRATKIAVVVVICVNVGSVIAPQWSSQISLYPFAVEGRLCCTTQGR